jgi:HK97 family phage portal protein
VGVLFSREKREVGSLAELGVRRNGRGSVNVTADSALRQSAVWAALRLRADLVSTMPFDLFRTFNGVQVEVPKTPFFLKPSGENVTFEEWLYSSQIDLDRVGNAYGLILARNGAGLPARIDLVNHADVTVLVDKKSGELRYRISGQTYPASDVWHEKQFTVSGLPVGLSPIAYAAWTLGVYQSAQQFALEWFANGGSIPSGHLKNTAKVLQAGEADVIKSRFKVAVEGRDLFVTGNDWEYSTINSAQADAKFLESQNITDVAAARFFGVPADSIDVPMEGSHITYASVAAKNLQLLIQNLNPALIRRERALSRLVADPSFGKFNRGSLLQMDPETQSKVLIAEVEAGVTFPSEARALMNRPPQTAGNLAELAALNAAKARSTTTTGVSA